MTTTEAPTALEREFAESVAELQTALHQAAEANTQAAQANAQAAQANTEAAQATTQAAEATTLAAQAASRVQTLIPRVGSISNLFAELDNVIRSGREQIGGTAPAPTPLYTRPTLVVPPPSASPATPQPFPTYSATSAPTAEDDAPATVSPAFSPASTAGLKSFRLEFESTPGPLDLRTVDDAVSEHPAVRDVALLDYDGRKATLKVWIEPTATPSEIQQSLLDTSSAIFANGNDVTIVALEDVA